MTDIVLKSGTYQILLPEPEYGEEHVTQGNVTRKMAMDKTRYLSCLPKYKELNLTFQVPRCSTIYTSKNAFINWLHVTRGTWYEMYDKPVNGHATTVNRVHILNSPLDIELRSSWYLFTLQLQVI